VSAANTPHDALHIWSLFQQTYLLAFRHLEQVTSREGLSHSQAAALAVLSAADHALPLSHVARYLTQEAQSTTELADRLERRGLVRRTRDARDRRLVLLELTPEGREVYERIRPGLVEGGEQLFGGLGDSERTRLAELLAPMRKHAAALLGIKEQHLRLIGDAVNGDQQTSPAK
jgi:DNA-binding MarR family transcriptional regulator